MDQNRVNPTTYSSRGPKSLQARALSLLTLTNEYTVWFNYPESDTHLTSDFVTYLTISLQILWCSVQLPTCHLLYWFAC